MKSDCVNGYMFPFLLEDENVSELERDTSYNTVNVSKNPLDLHFKEVKMVTIMCIPV